MWRFIFQEQNGIWSALPFLIMWVVALISGFLSDFLVEKQVFSLTTIRKVFTTVGAFFQFIISQPNKIMKTMKPKNRSSFAASVGPAAGVVAASYAGCDKTAVVTLFTVGMAFMGFFYPSLKVNALDLSPNYAGTLMAIVNGIGAISGAITPMIVGFIATDVSSYNVNSDGKTLYLIIYFVL